MTRVYGKTETSPPSRIDRKYKMAKKYSNAAHNIWLYHGVELLCKIRAKSANPFFSWGNRGSLSFFTHTHNQSVKQILSSRLQITYGRIWNNYYGSNRAVLRLDVPFGGIVDDKSCLVGPNSRKTEFLGSKWAFQAKTTKKLKPFNLKTSKSIMKFSQGVYIHTIKWPSWVVHDVQ